MIRTFLAASLFIAALPASAQNLAAGDAVTKALLEQMRADQAGGLPPASGGPAVEAIPSEDTLTTNLRKSLTDMEGEDTQLEDMSCTGGHCTVSIRLTTTDPTTFAERLFAVETSLADASRCGYGVSATPGENGAMQISATIDCDR